MVTFMRKFLPLVLLLSLILSGCQAAIQTPDDVDLTPLPGYGDTPTPTDEVPGAFDDVSVPPAAQAAQMALAQQLQLPLEAVEILAVEPVDWPDGCLGLAGPEELCTQAIVPGYLVTLRAQEQFHKFRTNLAGTAVRQEPLVVNPEATPMGSGELPTAVEKTRLNLAEMLGITIEEIRILEFHAVEWPNTCLGVVVEGEMCAEMIVPGYLVLLESQGLQYEMHTDLEGIQIRLAALPLVPLPPVSDS